MYNLAPRILATTVTRTGTDDLLGPSTYVLCNPRDRRPNKAPFLSTKERKPSFIKKVETTAIYDSSVPTHIKGGHSLRNRARRFVYKAEQIPGPGVYDLKPLKWLKKRPKLDPTKPKVYLCPVPYSLTCSAPSIPTKIDENGYDIDLDGNITKVPPDEPEFLDLEIKSIFPGTKGWRWACRSTQRFKEKQYDTLGPGPAAYSIELPKCQRREEDDLYRELARRFGLVPRFIEAQEMKIAKENLPGPGHYDYPRPPAEMAESIYPRPFIVQGERFKDAKSDTPSPTKYKICDCYRVQKQFSTKCVPFGNEAPRFKRKIVTGSPGPGDYEIKGPIREKLESKMNPYALFRPPFNSTKERKSVLVDPAALETPSPDTYPVEDEDASDEEGMEIYASVFKSAVERFGPNRQAGVSPDRYETATSFKKNCSRKCFSVAELPFNSTGVRSATPTVKFGVPCSTMYRNEVGLSDKGYYFADSPRFPEPCWCSPGPGSYNIHPGFEVSTYKAWNTHNLRLKENVLRKKLRQAPKETRRQWQRVLKKKRLLKWFNVGPDMEERMAELVNKLFSDPL